MELVDQEHRPDPIPKPPAVALSFVSTKLVQQVRQLQEVEKNNKIIKEPEENAKSPDKKKRKVITIEISLEEGYGITFSN